MVLALALPLAASLADTGHPRSSAAVCALRHEANCSIRRRQWQQKASSADLESPAIKNKIRPTGRRTRPFCRGQREEVGIAKIEGSDDPLVEALGMAMDEELEELSQAMYGTSIFSPLGKSLLRGDGREDYHSFDNQHLTRADMQLALASRFRFLATDAFGLMKKQYPSYSTILVTLLDQLGYSNFHEISYGNVEMLEAHLLIYVAEREWDNKGHYPQWLVAAKSAIELGKYDLFQTILTGSAAVIVGQSIAKKSLWQGARSLAAAAARKHLRKQAMKSGMARLVAVAEPLLWGVFAVDLVKASFGPDLARVCQACTILARIRILHNGGKKQN